MIQYAASELVLTHTHTVITLNSGPSLPFMVQHCREEGRCVPCICVCVCVCADRALINNSTPYCF